VSSCVAKAAIETGVARRPITDWEAYKKNLDKRLSVHIKKVGELSEF
jgi:malate dehydrogenase (oxaloacetate-decarboxylating)(NADP+)